MLKKLYNQKSKDLLIKRLESEEFERITCSFYKYFKIDDPTSLRDEIYSLFDSLEILGRIYIASEGINAQISVPEKNWAHYLDSIVLPGVMWEKTWDPEGILSTLPSIGTGILGLIGGYIITSKNELKLQ